MAIDLMVGDAVSGGGYARPMPQQSVQGDPQQEELWQQFQQWLQQRRGGGVSTPTPPPMGSSFGRPSTQPMPPNVGSDPRQQPSAAVMPPSYGRPSTQPMPPPMGQPHGDPRQQLSAHVMPGGLW